MIRVPLFVLLLLFIGCSTASELPAKPQSELSISIGPGESVAVTVYTPPRIRADVLVLPGYKHDRQRWVRETELKARAMELGFQLICPEMSTTIYESAYFPQTRSRWKSVPGLVFVTDHLLPELKKQKITSPDRPFFLLGLSTGARGAALIALASPQTFRAVGMLSGDYDQTRESHDRLITAVYGSYSAHKERWKNTDNSLTRASQWKHPAFLAHGKKDTIVPSFHTQIFYDALKAEHPDLEIVLEMPPAGHDYFFWGPYGIRALDFFAGHMN
ncbi:MAG: prolyl oligopeptidase family serine peptidase [Spirochaetales bacterium]|nr:prolyl oligopeptidase family serine peptidase [Spirochaetales bacterium]